MNQVLPPPTSALNDALALVRLALNPKEASDYIERLAAQTSAHEEARNAIIGKSQELDIRENAIADKESILAKREASVTDRETEVASLVASVKLAQAGVVADSKDLLEAKLAHAEDVEKLAQLKANAEQVIAAAHQTIDAREKDVAEKEAAHDARLARLKELT